MRFRLLALFLLALCFACSKHEQRVDTIEPTVTDTRPVDGGTLVRRLDLDIVTLNPVVATSKYDRWVDNYLYTPLIYLDQNLRPMPGLAKSWKVSDDGLVYRMKLNPKATFSDGTPVLAGDVVFTLRKIVDPASEAVQVSSGFSKLDVAHTVVVDDHTVDVAFLEPLAMQLVRFNDVLVLPEHVYSKGNFRADYNSTAVGSGPYRLVRRDAGKQVILERRDDYWGEMPHIQTVVFKVIADHATAWNALKLGEIDETIIASDTWQRERTNPELTARIDFQRFYTLGYNFIAWNEHDPLFQDKRVRRALAMCVPTEAIIQDLYHGTARAMTGPFTPDEEAYNPTVPAIRYDPSAAKQLLASAGWLDHDGDGILEKNHHKFRFSLQIMPGGSTTNQFAQMLQAELKKIGVVMEIITIDGAAGIQRVLAGNFQAAYLAWEVDVDPDVSGIFHSSQFPPIGQNFVFYSRPEVDRLIDDARLEFDASKRKELYWKLHEILADEQPYTWTVQVSSKWGIAKRIRGVAISRGYGLYLWYPGEFAWWIPRELQTRERTNQ